MNRKTFEGVLMAIILIWIFLALLMASCLRSYAQSTVPSPVPKQQFFDSNGNPLAGGCLYSYAAGGSTPLATYADSTLSSPNTNPVTLDSGGRANLWLASSSYKLTLTTATLGVSCPATPGGTTIWTVDNINPYAVGIPQRYTVATLPATAIYGQLATVTDASGISCTTGGSTSIATCQWNGSAWVPLLALDTSGNLSYAGDLTVENITATSLMGIPFSTQFAGATVADRVTAAAATTTGSVLIPPNEVAGNVPTSLPASVGGIDLRGLNSGNGGFFVFRQLGSADSVVFSAAALNSYDGINARAIQGDLTLLIGTSASSNYTAVQGLIQSPNSAAVGGTNYGGVGFTFSGTFTSSGTAITGVSSNYGSSNNLAVGDWVAPSGERPMTWARRVTAVGSTSSITLSAAFPTDVTDASTLVRIDAADGTHGDVQGSGGIGVQGVPGVGGNIYRPSIGLRGYDGNSSNYALAIQGLSPTTNRAGQFCSSMAACLQRVADSPVLDIQSGAAVSANGQVVADIIASTDFATLGSGPIINFYTSDGTTKIAQYRCKTTAGSPTYLIGCSLYTYSNGSLVESLAMHGEGEVSAPNGKMTATGFVATAATPTVTSGQLGIGTSTAAASTCGSLSGASGCLAINLGGTAKYIPYW